MVGGFCGWHCASWSSLLSLLSSSCASWQPPLSCARQSFSCSLSKPGCDLQRSRKSSLQFSFNLVRKDRRFWTRFRRAEPGMPYATRSPLQTSANLRWRRGESRSSRSARSVVVWRAFWLDRFCFFLRGPPEEGGDGNESSLCSVRRGGVWKLLRRLPRVIVTIVFI
jgi:hypothetical protein